MAAKRFGRGARSFERRAAPKVRAFGQKAGTKVGTGLSAANIKVRYGLTPRQYATWVRLSNKLDDAEELTPAELAAYNRINEKARMHRERLKELGLRAGSSAKRLGRAFYGSGRLRA